MGKKKSKHKKLAADAAPVGPESQVGSGAAASGAARMVAVGLLLAGGAVFVYALSREGAPPPQRGEAAVSSTTAVAQRDPGQNHEFRYFEDPAQAHPLPVTLPPSQFRNQGIANSYQIAKEIPEVLAQQPCLCGCDNTSDDHRSLLDCYIDDHASTCLVCMKEAVLAKQMTEAGEAAADIRAAILRGEFSEVAIGN